MQKGGSRLIRLFVLFMVIFGIGFAAVSAAEGNSASGDTSDIPDKFAGEKLERGSGITPDSSFYFLEDKILSRFRGDLENREKKIAEFREMIKEGKVEYAKKALERYREYADNLEKEVTPERKEEAQKSAAAIRNAIKEIESEISSENKKEFVDNVVEKENKISKAAEIANKIKELCESLSGIDLEQYARVCKTDRDENAPKWQRELDEKLTEEQKNEAEEFFNTMSQCFGDPKNCKCDEIKIEKFAEVCREKAPLAVECKEGKKDSCDKLNSGEDMRDLLPEHLQPVLDKVERRFSKAEFDNFMPPECAEAGAKTPQECQKIMFKEHAPEECIKALDEGKISFDNPRQADKMCQEIMFVSNAPEECVQAGLRDPKECSKLMFKSKAPEECVQAGLTGENQKDHRKCEEIMKSKNEKDAQNRGQGYGFGKDCKAIKDSEERLKCFDEMTSSFESYRNQGEGKFGQGGFGPEGKENGMSVGPKIGLPDECVRANIKDPEECKAQGDKMRQEREQRMKEEAEKYRREFERNGGYCPPGQECPRQEQQPPYQSQYPGQQPGVMPGSGAQEPSGEGTSRPAPEQGTEIPPASGTNTDSSGSSSSSTGSTEGSNTASGGETSSSSSSESTSGGTTGGDSGSGGTSGGDSSGGTSGGTTGGVIVDFDFGDNGFLNYYFR